MLTLARLTEFCVGPTLRLIALACSLVALVATCAHSDPPKDPYVAAGVEDASLNSVFATSPDRVWAVGDRGAIWATIDGGRKWLRQESGTTANLHAVAFKNSSEGCAVGGLPGALARTSRSVVLRTSNGGETWNVVPSDGVPRLTGMRLVGGRLIAWGDYSPQRRSGIFYSVNDGQTWQAIESSISHVASLGSDASGGVLAVDRIGNAFSSQIGPLRSFFASKPHQPINFVERVGSTWLAGGADGQLLRTIDGQSWSRVTLPLSAKAQRVCNWQSIAQFEDHLWIAGAPGSLVLYSADRGVSWQVQSTEQTLPLRSIVFADSQRGWAVGPLGLILATRDGGRTWYSQNRTATRVGLLAVTAIESQVPWPALVATSWDEMTAAKSLTLFAENIEQSADYRVENWKLNEAIAPQIGLVEHQSWLQPELAAGSQADLSPLVDRLAIELQTWRPDVILTDESGGAKLALANRATTVAITTAIQLAAANSKQSISEELKLPVWQTTKLATVTDARSSQYSEHPNRLMREPGLSIWDVMIPTGKIYDANAESLAMRTIQQSQGTLASNKSLFGGIAPSKSSRRQINLRSLGNYQLIMGRVHRIASLDNLVNIPAEVSISEWESQLNFVTKSLPPREVVSSLQHIITACSSPALWPRRQLALERLIQVRPDNDTASSARLTLLQMMSSDELRAWKLTAESNATSSTSIGSLRTVPNNIVSRSAATPFESTTVSASATESIGGSSVVSGAAMGSQDAKSQVSVATFATTSNASEPSSAKSKLIEAEQHQIFFNTLDDCYKRDSALAKLPQLELMREAMSRGRSDIARSASASNAILESIARLSALAGWPQVAQQELMLANDRPEQLRWVAFAVATKNRPRLDGVLDESLWSACPPMKLLPSDPNAAVVSTGASTGSPVESATVRWSYDDRYLYIALECPRESRTSSTSAPLLRKYDNDLEAVDHLHLMLDTDRDYGSAIEFGVSASGETFDRCCDLVNYNPQYAVAVPESPRPDRWVVEIAIRLSDLTTKQALTGRAWAVSAHRRTASGDHQSWSSVLTEQPTLQSAGLLLFVQPPE